MRTRTHTAIFFSGIDTPTRPATPAGMEAIWKKVYAGVFAHEVTQRDLHTQTDMGCGMKLLIRRASLKPLGFEHEHMETRRNPLGYEEGVIELNTMGDLLGLLNALGDLIVTEPLKIDVGIDARIEIYDDYVE